MFPIGPKYLLMGDFRNKADGQILIPADRVRYFNDRHLLEAHEQLYASFRSEELQKALDKVFKERAHMIQKPPPGLL